ncbi:MAG: DNA-processing protein DprA, partial [bacterium]
MKRKQLNNNIKYWLAINNIPDLGPVTIKKLVDHFGSIDKVWQADHQEILQTEGVNRKAVNSFLNNRKNVDPETELAKIAGVNVVTLDDESYPELLKHIYDPPPVLYFKGELAKPEEKTLAIVGTRKASRYGLEFAKKLAIDLAGYGITIVS